MEGVSDEESDAKAGEKEEAEAEEHGADVDSRMGDFGGQDAEDAVEAVVNDDESFEAPPPHELARGRFVVRQSVAFKRRPPSPSPPSSRPSLLIAGRVAKKKKTNQGLQHIYFYL